ncbi:MAG: terminase family protein [Thiotrichaceae bacterium]
MQAILNENQLFNTMLPSQIDYVLNDADILGVEKGRQQGFTWVSAYRVLRRIFTSPIPQDHYWVSRDEFTAKLFLKEVLLWLRVMNTIHNHQKEFKEEIIDTKNAQTFKITFSCGSSIYVMSSSIDGLVGKTGHIYIDEAAVHKDFERMYAIAEPCATWGGSLTFISTHRSKQNFFYKLCDRLRKNEIIGGELMTITLERILSEEFIWMEDGQEVRGGTYLDRVNARNKLLGKDLFLDAQEFYDKKKQNSSSEEIFMQEYMCIPADAEATQAVTEEDLSKVMFPQMDLFHSPKPGNKYYAGIDIGRNRDLTVVWICEDVSTSRQPMLITRFIETMSQTEFSTQEKKLVKILQQWKPRHCVIDGTNVGAMLAENLEKRFGFCEMTKFTSTTRPKYISALIAYIRRDPVALKIPNSNTVWEDFLSVQRMINKRGEEDFYIPTHTGTSNSHGDRFIAMCLCLQAFRSKRSLARYTIEREEGEKKAPRVQPRRQNVRDKFRY